MRIYNWRRVGMSDDEIADRLGVDIDTLRRRKAFAFADELEDRAPSPNKGWVRTPLVVADAEAETTPGYFERWTDPRLAGIASVGVDSLKAQFRALTAAGPNPVTPEAIEQIERRREIRKLAAQAVRELDLSE
jgi:hypothetical protein